MLGQLRGDPDGHERLDDKVGPEDVHYLQGDHHEDHEGVREVEDAQLEFAQVFAAVIGGVEGRDDAD